MINAGPTDPPATADAPGSGGPALADVRAEPFPGGGRHVESPQLAVTAIPDAELHLVPLGHREHVEGDERVHGVYGRADPDRQPEYGLRQQLHFCDRGGSLMAELNAESESQIDLVAV
jgi:hypothetical protein